MLNETHEIAIKISATSFLRVRYKEQENSMEVITAYLASKIDRYRMTGIRVYYDPKHDVMYIEFSDRSVVNTVEVKERNPD